MLQRVQDHKTTTDSGILGPPPSVQGPAAPSTATTNAAAILHWPAAAATTASALCACACAATLSGPVCDDVLEKTEGRVVARAHGSQPSSKDAQGAGLKANGKQSEGAPAHYRRGKVVFVVSSGLLTL
ncbi:uncharacterized protein LOC131383512 [Hylobates moloch]|uniref:uncharacterized protein LOC131383512 n=1 Tax=Hylobates moloch TaxID=81572 RepID=UPI002675BC68|nr:uncharacterized protein LOC131383512 [Hylobates moloch]